MLTDMGTILRQAKKEGYGVAAPNAWSLNTVKSIFEAASELKAPVIIDGAGIHQIEEISDAVHFYEGSGTGDDNLKKAVQTGIQKVNLCTDLSNAGLETLKGYLQIDYDHMKKDGSLGEFGNKTANMFDLSNEMRIGYKEALKHYITLFGSVNKA